MGIPFGVVGVGHLGKFHARLAAGIPELDFQGVYDVDRTCCLEVAETTGVTACSSLDDLLQRVDAVSIVVPTVMHHEVARAALEAGCHVFLEKPITATVAEAEDLIQLAEARGLKLQVGHIERFNPALLALEGHDIRPMFIESHRLSPFNPRGTDVSVVLDLMIHDLDIILNLVGSPVASVDSCGVAVVSEVEDIANVRISFENGAVANVTSSRISMKAMRRMRLFQPNKYLILDFLEKKAEIFTLPEPGGKGPGLPVATLGTGDRSRPVYYDRPQSPEVNALEMELREFARAVSAGENTKVTGREGLRALELATTILRQMKRGPATGRS
ncbi:MAG: Gfo/Idh/MocA family oxidoreductase [Deltaproteobacteria bacterium]|nr:Gfo/Idh/MocA family oxidoreductase [Deltaproteobacteria bacterium]